MDGTGMVSHSLAGQSWLMGYCYVWAGYDDDVFDDELDGHFSLRITYLLFLLPSYLATWFVLTC